MNPLRLSRKSLRAALAGLLIGGLGMGIFCQPAAAVRRRTPVVPQSFDSVKPQLLNAGSNPTLRFPIAYIYRSFGPGLSYGWLDITREKVRYTPQLPPARVGKGFEFTSAEMRKAKFEKSGFLQFETSQGKFTIFYMPEHAWQDIRTGFFSNGYGGVFPYVKMNRYGTSVIQEAVEGFDKMVARVTPPPPPPPVVNLVAAPQSVEKGQPVTLSWTSTHSTGADLEPGIGKVAPTGTTSVMPEQTTDYTVTATGPGGSVSASAHVTVKAPPPAAPPTLILVDPAVETSGQKLEVHNEMFSIRGVATDQEGLPTVTINGVATAMKPRGAHSAEFWSDPAKLQAGDNQFQIVATGPHGVQAHLNFVAHYAPPAPPPAPKPVAKPAPNPQALSLPDIVDLLKNFVPSERVADLIKQFGLKFVPTEDDLDAIRKAGGSSVLIDAVRQAGAAEQPKP